MLLCRLTGSMWSDGRISIGQCDLVESWDNLSLSQKKNLNYRYQMGCECRVSKDCSLSIRTYSSFVPLIYQSRNASKNKANRAFKPIIFHSCSNFPSFVVHKMFLCVVTYFLFVYRHTFTPRNYIIHKPGDTNCRNNEMSAWVNK